MGCYCIENCARASNGSCIYQNSASCQSEKGGEYNDTLGDSYKCPSTTQCSSKPNQIVIDEYLSDFSLNKIDFERIPNERYLF